ncbi:hypothetical protein XENTR_v10015184 [Xenopus tropicalis]|nr:hypothetical protein XENTR_v10015184 [Xenopus tropicalis]
MCKKAPCMHNINPVISPSPYDFMSAADIYAAGKTSASLWYLVKGGIKAGKYKSNVEALNKHQIYLGFWVSCLVRQPEAELPEMTVINICPVHYGPTRQTLYHRILYTPER